jgi:hypothetical protein
MKSYRQVLLSRVPEGQRTSARALIQTHGLPFPSSLSALVRKLEGGTPTPPPPPPPPPPSAFISVSIGFDTGAIQNRVLRITGNGFAAGEQVKLQITTKVDGAETDTTETTTTANSLSFLEPFETNVVCAVDQQTTFQVQATGLLSSKQASGGASC